MKFFYKPLITLIPLFILFHLPASAITYYFSTSGSDANSGLSASSPKQSIAAATELMGDGNTILFKRGDIWYLPQKTIVLDNKSNFTLNAYGTGKRPVIAGMALIKDAWTYEGDNIWSSPTIYTDALRVFVDNVSRISLDDKADNNPVRADLNSSDEYLYEKTAKKLLIYHHSSTTPPENVVMIPGWPAPSLVNMLNTTNVTIRNIEFWGGGNIATIRINAPSSNINIDNCVITRSNLMGIFAINAQQNMNVVENLVIQNCIIDKSWTLAENNLKPTVFLDGDGVSFMHGVKNSLVKNCKISNWGHDGISVIATEFTTGIYGVKHNKFEGNEIFAGNSAYMHAFGITGYKDLAMYNIFKRNYCHGFSSANTVGGNTNFVFSNIFATVEVSPLLQHSQAPHAINLATWTLKDKRGISASVECKNNWIVNNTIYNTDTYAFLVDRSNTDGDVTTLAGNKIYNNLLHNYGLDTSFVRDLPTSNPPVKMGVRILTNVTAGVTSMRNNNFWAEWDSTATRAAVLYHKRYYNAAQLTDCIECGPNMVGDNTQSNPFFGKFYKLTSSSDDYLKTGGYSYAAAMIADGLPSGELVDYSGKVWPNVGKSIGAIQYIDGNDQVVEGGDTTYYKDADGDTFGDPNENIVASSIPEGYVRNGDDFDDNDADLYPGAVEKCNGKDDNGNGIIDEGAINTYFKDADGDQYGDPAISVMSCSAPEGFVDNPDDFDDTDPTLHPGAAEICNGRDDNGNGSIDEGVTTAFYLDKDGDGYGSNTMIITCTAPANYVANNNDCNDNNAAVHPDATEVCNGIDDNCDGEIDEGVKTTYYFDEDGDGYGNKNIPIQACAMPAGYVMNSNDCNDNSSAINPGATEICDNGIDDNCNGIINEGCVAVTPPTITINDPTVQEYNSGTRNVVFTLTLNKASTVPVSVSYATANNDATTADYVTRSGTITFAANVRTATFTIGIKGDILDEVNETFRVVLSKPVNATIAKTTGTCRITDDDVQPYMVIADATATENSQVALVKVSLNTISGRTVSVKFDTRNGTAVAPADYTSQLNGVLSFAPGEKEKYIRVTIKKDNIKEVNEKFNVALKEPSLVTVTRFVCVVTIQNSTAVVAKTLMLEEAPVEDQELEINATPNPSTNRFTLRITGGEGPLTVRATDARGRLVEIRTSVQPNSTITMGAGWMGGSYFIEAFDRKKRVSLKLIKIY